MAEPVVRKCIACGGTMQKLFRQYWGINSLSVDQLAPELRGKDNIYLELWNCGACGRADLCVSLPQEIIEETVTCPVCGAKHSPGVGCPRCAMNNAMFGRRFKTSGEKKQKERKMPWDE